MVDVSSFIEKLAIISTFLLIVALLIVLVEYLCNLGVRKIKAENPHFELNQLVLNVFMGCRIIAVITFVGSAFLWIYYLIIK